MIPVWEFIKRPVPRNEFFAEVLGNGVGFISCDNDRRTAVGSNNRKMVICVTPSNHDEYMTSGASLRRVSRITQQGGFGKLLTDEPFFFIQHQDTYFKFELAQECTEKQKELERDGYVLFAGKVYKGN